MKILTRDLIPCWYELGFLESPTPAILLRVHKQFAQAEELFECANFFRKIQRNLDLKEEFETEFGKNLGFGGCLKYKGSQGRFYEYEVPIPQVHLVADKECERCKGSGQHEFLDRACFHCAGTGKQTDYDPTPAYLICASLCGLTNGYLSHTETYTSEWSLQLLELQTGCRKEMDGSAFSGMLSRPVADWLRSQPSGVQIPEMNTAMIACWSRLEGGLKEHEKYGFHVSIDPRDGALHASCPGNGCGFDPHYHGIRPEQGYKIMSHNVDTPMQQLTLLAGLAVLHDLVRKEIG